MGSNPSKGNQRLYLHTQDKYWKKQKQHQQIKDVLLEDNQVQKQEEFNVLAKYVKGKFIGKGTYGKVYQMMNINTGQKFAMKTVTLNAIKKQDAIKQINNIKGQIYLLKKLSHENIIKYQQFEISNDKKSVCIIMQLSIGGTIKDKINKFGRLKQVNASVLIRNVLRGLAYLHSQNIIHRDLKCANLLLDKNNVVKISDFGTAKQFQGITIEDDIINYSKSLKGTPYWMAPEVIKRTGHDLSADIWSVGCVLVQMLSGQPPWYGLSKDFKKIVKMISTDNHPPFPMNISQQAQNLLLRCFQTIPSARATPNQLLADQFISKELLLGKYQNVQSKSISFQINRNIRQNLINLVSTFEQHKGKVRQKSSPYTMKNRSAFNEQALIETEASRKMKQQKIRVQQMQRKVLRQKMQKQLKWQAQLNKQKRFYR